jgi:hypothetical protein
LKTSKKKKRKRLYWLLADLAVAVIILSLLLYKPARYHRPKLIYDGRQSTYLTHELLAQIYNRAQEGEPFEQEIAQDGIDGIITHSRWPKDAGGASFLAPTVFFEPDGIVLIGPVLIRGIELVVTVILKPSLDEEGLLRLRVEKIRIGAINVTPVAAAVAKKMYRERAAQMPLDMDDVRTKIVASLLTGEPFEPVFDVYDSKVRIEKITLERERIVLRLVPVFR